jgi:hypothetical protein
METWEDLADALPEVSAVPERTAGLPSPVPRELQLSGFPSSSGVPEHNGTHASSAQAATLGSTRSGDTGAAQRRCGDGGAQTGLDDAIAQALADPAHKAIGAYPTTCASSRVCARLSDGGVLQGSHSALSVAVLKCEELIEAFLADPSMETLQFPAAFSSYQVRTSAARVLPCGAATGVRYCQAVSACLPRCSACWHTALASTMGCRQAQWTMRMRRAVCWRFARTLLGSAG